MSTFQHPGLRYVFPRGAFAYDGLLLEVNRWMTLEGGNDSEKMKNVSLWKALVSRGCYPDECLQE